MIRRKSTVARAKHDRTSQMKRRWSKKEIGAAFVLFVTRGLEAALVTPVGAFTVSCYFAPLLLELIQPIHEHGITTNVLSYLFFLASLGVLWHWFNNNIRNLSRRIDRKAAACRQACHILVLLLLISFSVTCWTYVLDNCEHGRLCPSTIKRLDLSI